MAASRGRWPLRVFELLAQLWLHEPDADTIARAVGEFGQTGEVSKTSPVCAADEAGLPAGDPAELALAYADVFLLNVYPYGTAFTDSNGELNGPEAQQIAALYEMDGYCPPELSSAGAPDHLGLCLGFLAHLEERGLRRDDFLAGFLEWAPVCCLAVEREPTAHLFYRALAALTRDVLLKRCALPDAQHAISRSIPLGRNTQYATSQSAIFPLPFDAEVSLRDILRFFLAPARCGMFLSRSRLGQMAAARELGLRLPFGSRGDVAESLFASAGEAEVIPQLLAALETEAAAWAATYRLWVERYPAWQPAAGVWLSRTEMARQTLADLRRVLASETT